MRALLKREVITQFEKEVATRLPQFELVSRKDALRWAWKMDPSLTFFILMDAAEDWDRFYVEVAWSENGNFPWGSIGKTKIDGENGRARLGRQSQSGKKHSWDLAPEKTASMNEHIDARIQGRVMAYPPNPPIEKLLPRISPLVHDAVDMLESYGMQLLRQVAEVRGLTWPCG